MIIGKKRRKSREMNIVVIDNNQRNLIDMTNYIRTLEPRHNIVAFTDPLLAVKHSLNHFMECVFTEVNLRPIDGFTMVKQIRDFRPEIFVVFLAESEEYLINTSQFQANYYLTKPITLEAVKKVFDILL